MKLNKKAISPLASTITMLMFAVLLGAIVMSWGSNYSVKEEKECDKTAVGIMKFNNEPQACSTGEKISFVIENNGKSLIDGFRVFVIGENIFRDDIQLMLSSGDVARSSFPYDGIIKPEAVKFVPRIEEKGFSTLCASNALTVDIKPCVDIGVE